MQSWQKIFYGIFSLIGGIFLAIGITVYAMHEQFKSNSVETEGIVVEMLGKGSTRGLAPVVSYEVNGKPYTYHSNMYSSPPSYIKGEKVKLYYNPQNPGDATIDDNFYLIFTSIFGGIGGIFFLVGAIGFYLGWKKMKMRQYLLERGNYIEADFTHVDLNTSIKVNRRSPFKVYCQWQSTYDKKLYTFESDNVWHDPTPFLKDKPILRVYLEKHNPKIYYVDISFLPEKGN